MDTRSEPLRRSERVRQRKETEPQTGNQIAQPSGVESRKVSELRQTTTVPVEGRPTAENPTDLVPAQSFPIYHRTRTDSSSHTSATTQRSHASRIRVAELQHAIELKELEKQQELKKFEKQRELLDLQLELTKVQIQEEADTECKPESVLHESPNVAKWAQGDIPWETTPSDRDDKRINRLNPTTSEPAILKILTRQSLPRDLPNFDGNPIDWPQFIYQYKNSNLICDFTNEENQARLQKCLKGEARRICQSLLIMPQNTTKVIELLQSRYGRPEYIINLMITKLKLFQIVKSDQIDQLIEFADEVKNFVAIVQSLDEPEHLYNPMLLQELLNKLPISYKIQWQEHLIRVQPKFKLTEFADWLDGKSNLLCQIRMPKVVNEFDQKSNQKPGFRDVQRHTTLTSTNNIRNCICCQSDNHHLSSCAKFGSMSVNERWSFVTSKKICFSCLVPFHNIRQCRKKSTCKISNCSRSHHELLHKEDGNGIETSTEVKPTLDVRIPETNCHIGNDTCVLLKVIPVIVKNGTVEVETFALLDDASTITIIDKQLATSINLSGPNQAISIQWTNDNFTQTDNDSKVVSFTVKSIDGRQSFQLRHVRTMELSLPSQTVDIDSLKGKYPYIGEKVCSMVNVQPKIIIGQDNWPLLINRQVITGPWKGPALSKTLLGWVIHGNISDEVVSRHYLCYMQTINNRDEQIDLLQDVKDDLDHLHDMIKEIWKVEEVPNGRNKPLSPEDRRAEVMLQENMRRVGSRYETGLLWKNTNVILPESRENAFRRLRCTERKMDRNPEYGQTYCEKFKDLESKGYIRKLSTEEVNIMSNKIWYLPHFGIVNPNKPNKLRIVFDAASKNQGVSLNYFLLTGPDLYNSLFTILLNFRIKKYAFTGDIKEMFLQVRVQSEDCHAQRVLWRGMDRHRDPDVYEIGVVFFGASCSPSLAQEAKNRNALEFKDKYPEAVKCIVEEHFVDDYLGGADSLQEATKLIDDIIHVHKQGGFVICNWIANCKEILQNLDEELVAEGFKNIRLNDTISTEKILGVFWNPERDIFEFQTKFHKVNKDILEMRRRPTKREVLTVVMSIFDPQGFLAHILIQGKILLQDIWRSQIGWDSELTDSLNQLWQNWVKDLTLIYKLQIPRQYFTLDRNRSHIQLHIFCDASERSYAAVAYLRVEEGDETQTSFVCTKTKVAPLKPMSIPRLELQAALIGARLGDVLKSSLKLHITDTFYWSDSKTVLYWIRSEARRFKVFVSQRIGEIQELTVPASWRYVTSKNNVADEATKRADNLNLNPNSRWYKGPSFLTLPIDQWDNEDSFGKTKELDVNTLERRTTDQENILVITENIHLQETLPIPTRFSKWLRLVRATAYVQRFVKLLRKNKIRERELQVHEIEEAELSLFKLIQHETFAKELTSLKANQEIAPTSKIYALSPVYSSDQIIRLSGRLDNSLLNKTTSRPIILDPCHYVTKLLIQYYHERFHHFGQESIINSIRQRFWILRLRQTVKNTKKNCQYCRVKKGKPIVPIMGQLPKCRVEPTIRPFIKTGVDLFGPLEVKVKRTHEKRYGVIFTCMATRAIHLEIAQNLSANEFINTLRQFGCRRGFPHELYCDNGSNFRGTDNELKREFESLNKNDVIQFCTIRKIKFYFNPALAPHMGG